MIAAPTRRNRQHRVYRPETIRRPKTLNLLPERFELSISRLLSERLSQLGHGSAAELACANERRGAMLIRLNLAHNTSSQLLPGKPDVFVCVHVTRHQPTSFTVTVA